MVLYSFFAHTLTSTKIAISIYVLCAYYVYATYNISLYYVHTYLLHATNIVQHRTIYIYQLKINNLSSTTYVENAYSCLFFYYLSCFFKYFVEIAQFFKTNFAMRLPTKL
jgi:hypothetical protein